MPTINPFDSIRSTETPTSSFRWYQDMIRKMGMTTITPQKALRSDIGVFVTTVRIGDMYLFMYKPKMEETLPYYDVVPLVVPFRKVTGGFYGLNFHYLSPMLRMRLYERMFKVITDDTMTETTRFQLTWKLLDSASRFPGAHACVKHYLYAHVKSRMMKINPADWRKSIMLPLDNFKKETRNTVWDESRSNI